MFGCFDDRRMTTHFTTGRFQLDGVDQLSAFVTLISPSVFVTAQGTGAFHETISQKSVCLKKSEKFSKFGDNSKKMSLHVALLAQKLFHSILRQIVVAM